MKWVIIIITMFCIIPITQASYWNYLTKERADNLYCSIEGFTMHGDINLNNNSLINANWINKTYSNSIELCIDGDCIDTWDDVNVSSPQVWNKTGTVLNPATKGDTVSIYGGYSSGANPTIKVSGGSTGFNQGASMEYYNAYGGTYEDNWKVAETRGMYGSGLGSWGGYYDILVNDGTGLGTMVSALKINKLGLTLPTGSSITGVGQLLLDKTGTTSTFGSADNNHLFIGGTSSIGSNKYNHIGFGYGSIASVPSAIIGYQTTSYNGQTKGDLVFGTRDVITATAPTERMRIKSGGNVTINKKLQVGENLDVGGNITAGRLGVNINPAYPLDVKSLSGESVVGRLITTDVNNNASLQLMERADLGAEIRYTGGAGNDLEFLMDDGSGFKPKFNIDRDTGLMSVINTAMVGTWGSESIETRNVIQVNVPTDNGGIGIKRTSTSNDAPMGIRFSATTAGGYYKSGIFFQRKSSGGVGDLTFAMLNSTTSASVTSADAKMTLKSNGRFGIGTTNPTATLDVNGSTNISGDLRVEGNINVTGCICYDGGATCLGTCV